MLSQESVSTNGSLGSRFFRQSGSNEIGYSISNVTDATGLICSLTRTEDEDQNKYTSLTRSKLSSLSCSMGDQSRQLNANSIRNKETKSVPKDKSRKEPKNPTIVQHESGLSQIKEQGQCIYIRQHMCQEVEVIENKLLSAFDDGLDAMIYHVEHSEGPRMQCKVFGDGCTSNWMSSMTCAFAEVSSIMKETVGKWQTPQRATWEDENAAIESNPEKVIKSSNGTDPNHHESIGNQEGLGGDDEKYIFPYKGKSIWSLAQLEGIDNSNHPFESSSVLSEKAEMRATAWLHTKVDQKEIVEGRDSRIIEPSLDSYIPDGHISINHMPNDESPRLLTSTNIFPRVAPFLLNDSDFISDDGGLTSPKVGSGINSDNKWTDNGWSYDRQNQSKSARTNLRELVEQARLEQQDIHFINSKHKSTSLARGHYHRRFKGDQKADWAMKKIYSSYKDNSN